MPVVPQAYSLTPAEILLATDRELNEFMSIKRYAPYKNDTGKWDAKRHQKLKELKRMLVERRRNGGWLVKDSHDTDINGGGRLGEGEQKSKKRKGKKERLRAKTTAAVEENSTDDGSRMIVGTDSRNVENLTNDSEVQSFGDYADSKKTKKTKKPELLMSLGGERELEKPEGKSHKRKRDDENQEQSRRQDKGNREDDESGKPKKKRRRRHKKGDQIAQVE